MVCILDICDAFYHIIEYMDMPYKLNFVTKSLCKYNNIMIDNNKFKDIICNNELISFDILNDIYHTNLDIFNDIDNIIKIAVEKNNIVFLKWYMNMMMNDDIYNKILEIACYANNINCIKYILGRNVRICNKNYLLHNMCSNSKTEIIKLLIQSNIDINEIDNRGKSVLHYTRNMDIAKLLLDANINVLNLDFIITPIEYVITTNNINILRLYLEYMRNRGDMETIIKSKQIRYMQCAIRYGNIDIFKLLIEYDFSIHNIDKRYGSYLHTAVINSKFNIIDYLINSGININIKDINGYTALDIAKNINTNIYVKLLSYYDKK